LRKSAVADIDDQSATNVCICDTIFPDRKAKSIGFSVNDSGRAIESCQILALLSQSGIRLATTVVQLYVAFLSFACSTPNCKIEALVACIDVKKSGWQATCGDHSSGAVQGKLVRV
jgi:hypothetical protein